MCISANKAKVLHGIAQEADLGVVLEDDEEEEEEKDKPKVIVWQQSIDFMGRLFESFFSFFFRCRKRSRRKKEVKVF